MAERKICSIDGCGKRAEKRGWCGAHYRRWRIHGDVNKVLPPAGGRKPEAKKPCSVADCRNASVAKGWCMMHYKRAMSNGSPEIRKKSANGEATAYFHEVVASYVGDDCLIWPYGKDRSGYGKLMVNRKLKTVSRLACEIENGPPPAVNLDAAHSCGNGHLGCCSRRHMRWATRSENVADMIAHGRARRPSNE